MDIITIKYEHIVLIPLLLLKEKFNKDFIDTDTLLEYKIAFSSALADDLIRVNIESGLLAKEKFRINYIDYVTTFKENGLVIYKLNDDVNTDDIWNKIYSELPIEIISYLTSKDIIDVINPKKLKK